MEVRKYLNMLAATEYWSGFFETEHLHPALKPIVELYRDLAIEVACGPSNPSTTEAIRLLVRSKDEACRAIVASGGLTPTTDETPCTTRLGNLGGPRCVNVGLHSTHTFNRPAQ